MSKQKRTPRTSPKQWAKQLFTQPSAVLYQKPAIYITGNEMELQNFRAVMDYTPNLLLVDLGREKLRVTGDALVILALEKGRLVLRGQILSVSFSDASE